MQNNKYSHLNVIVIYYRQFSDKNIVKTNLLWAKVNSKVVNYNSLTHITAKFPKKILNGC